MLRVCKVSTNPRLVQNYEIFILRQFTILISVYLLCYDESQNLWLCRCCDTESVIYTQMSKMLRIWLCIMKILAILLRTMVPYLKATTQAKYWLWCNIVALTNYKPNAGTGICFYLGLGVERVYRYSQKCESQYSASVHCHLLMNLVM